MFTHRDSNYRNVPNWIPCVIWVLLLALTIYFFILMIVSSSIFCTLLFMALALGTSVFLVSDVTYEGDLHVHR